MRPVLILASAAVVFGGLLGCSKEEEPKQATPPPTKEQLGTGQQFGFQPEDKK
jgi:hypothetical protein